MIAWLALIALVAAEVVALRWWLNKEYYPVFFNPWAALIYCAVLVADFAVMWLVAAIFAPGETAWPQLLVLLGVGAFIVTLLYIFFFRWIVRQDLSDPE